MLAQASDRVRRADLERGDDRVGPRDGSLPTLLAGARAGRRRRGELRDARADDHRRHHAAGQEGQAARDLLPRHAGRLRARLPARRVHPEACGAGARRSSSVAGPGIALALLCLADRRARAQARSSAKPSCRATIATLFADPAVPPRGARLLRAHRGDRRVLVLGAEVPLGAVLREPGRGSARGARHPEASGADVGELLVRGGHRDRGRDRHRHRRDHGGPRAARLAPRAPRRVARAPGEPARRERASSGCARSASRSRSR